MKSKLKKKSSKIKRKNKYAVGGMYQENMIPPGIGSTSNTVYQESDPALQEQRRKALADKTEGAIEKSSEMAEEIKADKEGDAAAANEAKAQSDSNFNSFSSAAQTFADAGKSLNKSKEVANPFRAAADVYKNARRAKETVRGVDAFNTGKAFMDSQKIARDGMQSFKMAKDIKASKDAISGLGQAKTLTMDGLKTAKQVKDAGAFGTATLGKGAELSTSIGAGGNMAASAGTQALAKGSAIGKGLKSFATSGAGLGTIASLAGMGVSKLSDDNDATKSNFGEYSGSILSGAGTGASIGSVIPGVGTAIGAGIGALYGAGKQFFGTRKAKREERIREKDRRRRIGEFNKDVTEDLASQSGRARVGEIRQKTYSGYDLGRNTTAKTGGYRNMPKYV